MFDRPFSKRPAMVIINNYLNGEASIPITLSLETFMQASSSQAKYR